MRWSRPCSRGEPKHRDPADQLEAPLQAMSGQIGETSKAVLVISGHWEEREFTVMSSPQSPMVYDYAGFPQHTCSIT